MPARNPRIEQVLLDKRRRHRRIGRYGNGRVGLVRIGDVQNIPHPFVKPVACGNLGTDGYDPSHNVCSRTIPLLNRQGVSDHRRNADRAGIPRGRYRLKAAIRKHRHATHEIHPPRTVCIRRACQCHSQEDVVYARHGQNRAQILRIGGGIQIIPNHLQFGKCGIPSLATACDEVCRVTPIRTCQVKCDGTDSPRIRGHPELEGIAKNRHI